MLDGMNVRFDYEELAEVRASVTIRREQLESVRKKMESAGLSTFTADTQIEVLDRVKVAIGDEPEDMFSQLDRDVAKISFKTVGGQVIECTPEQLSMADNLLKIRALYVAGTLPDGVKRALQDQGFWHLVGDDEGPGA